MPVVFQPAQPFAPQIASAYGATQQFNQTLPTLAGLYEARARNALQQRLATQGLDAQVAQGNADRMTRSGMAEMGMQVQEREQQRQIQAERESREDQLASAMILQNQRVSQQEQMRYQQQVGALNTIQQMVSDGTLSKEDAAAAVLDLRSGIDLYQMRAKKQQADDYAAQAQLRRQQAQAVSDDQTAADSIEAERKQAGLGTLKFHDEHGRPNFLFKNPKTGEWYNPKLSHDGGEGPAQKAQEFVLKQKEAEIKHWEVANKAYINAQERADKIVRDAYAKENPNKSTPTEVIEAEVPKYLQRWGIRDPGPPPAAPGSGPSQATGGETGSSKAAPNTPAAAVDAFQTEVVDKLKSDPYAMAAAQEHVNAIREIQAKYKDGSQAPPEVRQRHAAALGALRQMWSQLQQSQQER